MTALRIFAAGWWMNMKQLMRSALFVFTSLIEPLIMATIAFYTAKAGGKPEALFYMAIGAGVMGIWSSTLFGSGGVISWQRWEGTLELLVNAPSRYDYILVGQTFGAVVFGFYGIVATLAWGVLLFGMPLEATFPLMLPLSLLAAIVSLGALGMLIATTFVLYRHANALGNLLEYPIWLVAGLLVPVATLPFWVRPISWLLAPTWGMEAIRGATIGADPPILAIAMCFILAVVYYVAARVTLVFVLAKARRDATLSLQ